MFFYILLLILLMLILYHRYNRSTRLIYAIPGPKAWPIIGNSLYYAVSPEKLFIHQRSLLKLYGDVNQIHGINLRMVNISNPKDIEKILSLPQYNCKKHPYTFLKKWLGNGLLINYGTGWQKRRRMITKAFQVNILRKFTVTFVEESKNFLKRVKDNVGKKQTDILPLFCDTTLRIMCGTAMGLSVDDEMQFSLKQYFKSLHAFGDCYSKRLSKAWLLSERIFQLSSIAKLQNIAIADLHNFTDSVIKYRRECIVKDSKEIDDDIDDDYKSHKKCVLLDLLLKSEKEGEIDHNGIREEVDTFMFAGNDTTGIAMTFMTMALANEPDVQNKVHEEMCKIFGDSDRFPTVEDLNEMKYLECCIKETLRVYPSAPLISRHLNEDTVLGGYTVPANTTCFIFIYDLHHRADIYPDPERFIPERFLPENSSQRHPYAFIPFSAGIRNCIGQKFALLEMKTVMSSLLRKFRLEPVTKPSDLVFKTDVVLRTNHPIYVRFSLRE